MSIKRTSKNGVDGFFIDVTVHVKNLALCNSKKQLRRNRFLSLRECSDKIRAKEIEVEWMRELQERATKGDNPEINDVTFGEIPSKKYPITYYDGYWYSICKKAGVKDIRFYDWKHHAVFFLRSKGFYDWLILRIGGATRDILEVYDAHDSDAFQDWAKEKLRENKNENQLQKSVIQLLMNANGMNDQERWDYIEQCAKENIDPAKVKAILEILNAPSVTAPQIPQENRPVFLCSFKPDSPVE